MNVERLLPRNEHGIERALRIAVGIVLLALIFVGPRSYWGLVGLLPLVTGLVGSCPLYTVLGLSTCPLSPGTKPAGASARGART